MSIDIYCDVCGATFRNACRCEPVADFPDPETSKSWRGIDGHAYYGDPERASQAMHSDSCGCWTAGGDW